MGHRLVSVAFDFVGAYNDRARAEGERQLEPLEVAVLAHMAHSARDSDPSPAYFAARAVTCSAMGLPDTEPARKRLQRAMRALIEAEAITKAEGAHRGSTPTHRLIFKGGALVSTFHDGRGTPEHPLTARKVDTREPKGGRQSTERGTPAHPPTEIQKKDSRARTRGRAHETIPGPIQIITVQPGERCQNGSHKLVADGTCARCDIRPEEVA